MLPHPSTSIMPWQGQTGKYGWVERWGDWYFQSHYLEIKNNGDLSELCGILHHNPFLHNPCPKEY